MDGKRTTNSNILVKVSFVRARGVEYYQQVSGVQVLCSTAEHFPRHTKNTFFPIPSSFYIPSTIFLSLSGHCCGYYCSSLSPHRARETEAERERWHSTEAPQGSRGWPSTVSSPLHSRRSQVSHLLNLKLQLFVFFFFPVTRLVAGAWCQHYKFAIPGGHPAFFPF